MFDLAAKSGQKNH